MKTKIVTAFILIVAMLNFVFIPALGETGGLHAAEATKLQQIGLMAGDVKDQKLDAQMTRLQGLIFAIRAAGKAKTAEAMTDDEVKAQLSKFTDSLNIPTYGKKYVAYAVVNRITLGIGNNKFGALDPISGTSFLVFLLKTGMGYTNITTSNVIDMAAEANVITFDQKKVYTSKPVLIRDDAAVILFNAVNNGINDDGRKFIDSLIDTGFVTRSTYESAIAAKNPAVPANGALTVEEIAKNVNRIVLLKNIDASGNPKSLGSGFVISKDGQIVTNYHVIDSASSMTATLQDGRSFQIESILAYDVKKDLAVLKAKGLVLDSALTIGDSSSVTVGQQVVAIGNPQGLQNTVSTGIISSIRFSSERNTNDFQISAPISSGSSGGPLFNMKGEVIGINYGGYSEGQNLNFSIPTADLKPMLNSLSPKTFSQVMMEAHPEPPMAELGDILYEKYGTLNIGGNIIKLDYYITQFASNEPETIYHFIEITDVNSIINYFACLYDTNLRDQLETKLVQIMEEVRSWYPDHDQYGGINVSFSTSTYPTGDYDEVTYNTETMTWDVRDVCFYFMKYGSDYNFELE